MSTTARATLGGGCFWCLEASFAELDGVTAVTSGYAGGDTEDPSYEEVCAETTGHAEVVQVEYDPRELSFVDLLEVFFTIHDPTQVDRQGPDVGTQYRSIILYHDDDQRETAASIIDELEPEYDREIATDLEPLETFYPAEAYHQDYFEKNPDAAYCRVHVAPKVAKVREAFTGHSRTANE